jgi:dinuclear metal center YbgI/SA1388 family protein
MATKIRDVADYLNSLAPSGLQESYDNSGLLVGDPESEVTGILIAVDPTEEIIGEAIQKGFNLVVTHHPLIFSGLKRLTASNWIERAVMSAIREKIGVYAMHTNLDNLGQGVNRKICDKLDLAEVKILQPRRGEVRKLVTFVPESHTEEVRESLFSAGAGTIGNYDMCSFNLKGEGTFRGLEGTNPYIGQTGKLSMEPEVRVEMVFPKYLERQVVASLLKVHPYEEVAYDIYVLENPHLTVGSGMIGQLKKKTQALEFLSRLKESFASDMLRYAGDTNRTIEKVAVCGGSGSFLIPDAIQQKADVFVSSDFKYHQFFDAEDRIILADIGHYESEQFTKEIIFEFLIKKYSTFAVQFSDINTNPVKYL